MNMALTECIASAVRRPLIALGGWMSGSLLGIGIALTFDSALTPGLCGVLFIGGGGLGLVFGYLLREMLTSELDPGVDRIAYQPDAPPGTAKETPPQPAHSRAPSHAFVLPLLLQRRAKPASQLSYAPMRADGSRQTSAAGQ
jgi:hypothetical protein